MIETGLHGKAAVITGGGSGIGLATVRRFAAEGAHVAVWDIQHPSTPLMPAEAPEEEGEKKATQEGLYRKWRTWQMSDHAPLWVEIETDFTDDYLERLAEAEE